MCRSRSIEGESRENICNADTGRWDSFDRCVEVQESKAVLELLALLAY